MENANKITIIRMLSHLSSFIFTAALLSRPQVILSTRENARQGSGMIQKMSQLYEAKKTSIYSFGGAK
jgi:hypothetical protein